MQSDKSASDGSGGVGLLEEQAAMLKHMQRIIILTLYTP